MDQRNWLQLSRKLVDQYDLDFTIDSFQAILGRYALSFFGEGVLKTNTYPNPFPITMSGSVLGGSVGNGIAFDPNGQLTSIDPSSTTPKTFTITPSDPTNPRWDLLVLRYAQTGDTPVPKPSDPITTIDLNLHDDFQLAVIPGTASPTPSYPSPGALDIVLDGLKVPANATLGTSVTVDSSQRNVAGVGWKSGTPSGARNGTNAIFVLPEAVFDTESLFFFVGTNVLSDDQFTLASDGVTVTITDTDQIPANNTVTVYAKWVVAAGVGSGGGGGGSTDLTDIAVDIQPSSDGGQSVGTSAKAWDALVLKDQSSGQNYKLTMVSGGLTFTPVP